MAFVSYAQNHEDVLLWRVLKEVKEGFYIDVGAWNPDTHSVTKAFYDRGWSGINIEPQPAAFRALTAARPRDQNLQVAIGARNDDVLMYSIPDTGLSTLSAAIAKEHHEHGYIAEEIWVTQRTLRSVCEEFVKGPIHFLKIDVEGAEHDVLEGADFKKFRPWIVVVESMPPLKTSDTRFLFSDILKKAKYQFALFDGLNSYFVAGEKIEMLDTLSVPVNVLDDYESFHAVRETTIGAAGRSDETNSIVYKTLQDIFVEIERLRDALGKHDEVITNQSHALIGVSQASEKQFHTLAAMEGTVAQVQSRFEDLSNAVTGAHADFRKIHDHLFDHISVVYHKLDERIQIEQKARDLHEAHTEELEDEIVALKASTTWRLTAPLRAVRLLPQLIRRQISCREFRRQILSTRSFAASVAADARVRSKLAADTRTEEQLFLRDLSAELAKRRNRAR